MVLKVFPLVLLGVLIFNMIQKRFIPNWGKKRMATLYIAITLAAFIAIAFFIYKYRLTDWLLIPGFLALLFFAIYKQKSFFPFSWKCEKSGKRLTPFIVFLRPENICKPCSVQESNEDLKNRE